MALKESAMLARLSVSQWTARKYDRNVSHTVNSQHKASDDAGRYNKQLITKSVLKDITATVSNARALHYRYTLPWSDNGARILPSGQYFAYMSEMNAYKDRFDQAVAKFISFYPSARANAKQTLGDLYNLEDYPEVDAIASKFCFDVEIEPMPTGADFRVDLGETETRRIQEEIEKRTLAMQKKAMDSLWNRIEDMVETLYNKLAEPNAIFQESLFNNAIELVQMLPNLNITNDPTMTSIQKQLEKRLVGIDCTALRKNKIYRRDKAEELGEMKRVLNGAAVKKAS